MASTPSHQALLEQANQYVKMAVEAINNGRHQHALKLLQQALAIIPNHFYALDCIGSLYGRSGQFKQALHYFTQACDVQPGDFAAHFNRGIALKELKRYDEAQQCLERAVQLKPGFPEGHNTLASLLMLKKQHQQALVNFDIALAARPDYLHAIFNRAMLLLEMKRFDEALAGFNKAIAIKPDYAEAYFGLGLLQRQQNQYKKAIESYDAAIALNPRYADAYFNRGCILRDIERHDDAYASFRKTLEIAPGHPFAQGELLLAQLYTGNWNNFNGAVRKLLANAKKGLAYLAPYQVIPIAAPIEVITEVTETFAKANYPAMHAPLTSRETKYRHERIRIGYFSADFHQHATAQLMAGVFEQHDRSRFEIYAYSFGPVTDDEMRQRLIKAFDHFFEVSQMNDQSIAELARKDEIDIAIDLKGYTKDSRPGIFAHRPAPIQVNYLGFPGTMALTYIDYIVADPVVIPAEHFKFYTEKVVHLPHSYQANDIQRAIAAKQYSRAELNLPEEAFVFCSFNNTYKITPDLFDIWMRLLNKVDHAVLWLLEGNQTFRANMEKEAKKRGVRPGRIIFAPKMAPDDHLARCQQADLFLDTLYCNAHTSASDALWAGLPLLTCMGKTFSSRVAASLLLAIDMPELITHTHEQYEKTALRLATHAVELDAIKRKLRENRLVSHLFNSREFTDHLEEAYSQMMKYHNAGQSPEQIKVIA